MTDRPILFSGPMVRALLDGRKSQTRRVLKPQPEWTGTMWHVRNRLGGCFCENEAEVAEAAADYGPYRPGDRLWVRETHAITSIGGSCSDSVHYAATPDFLLFQSRDGTWNMEPKSNLIPAPDRWSGSIHMPRWASRITLIVTDVRVQRLQDISEEDAIAEGVERGTWSDAIPILEDPDDATAYAPDTPIYWAPGDDSDDSEDNVCFSAREAFERLWTSILGWEAWDENPFVAAITFTTHHCNIDKMEPKP